MVARALKFKTKPFKLHNHSGWEGGKQSLQASLVESAVRKGASTPQELNEIS
jgi:hypothetical protein